MVFIVMDQHGGDNKLDHREQECQQEDDREEELVESARMRVSSGRHGHWSTGSHYQRTGAKSRDFLKIYFGGVNKQSDWIIVEGCGGKDKRQSGDASGKVKGRLEAIGAQQTSLIDQWVSHDIIVLLMIDFSH